MKTTPSIADSNLLVNVRPAWADTTEGSNLLDGTPTLIHSTTTDGGTWMVTVEREDLINEDGVLTPGAPKVLAEFNGEGHTPAELFGYAEALRKAAHLLVELRAAN